jgi:eukaryotic-like serine/threonine-protein kinase
VSLATGRVEAQKQGRGGVHWDTMSAPHDPGLVGTVIGGSYRITRLIGQGGMGAVYEGVQTRLERRVAIKLMARELSANPEAIARFRREAEVTSQIGHPHIVQVFDFGQAPGGEPYIVMEYLEGEDLEKRIQRMGSLPLAAASHIVRQVASALSATHAKGIVHRDLKPANVFLLAVEGETDFVKVVDFGISKVRSATTKLTAALAVMGTPNYMAPEQAAGRINDIDPRTDQWALACIAYELIAGRPPFVGEDVASLLYQVIHQAPSPLAAFNPGLPNGVEVVLRRALSKTQAERFPTLTEFSRAFEGAASGKAPPAPAPAHAPSAKVSSSAAVAVTTFSGAAGEAAAPGETLRVRPRRHWWLVGVGAAAALGAGAFAMVSRRSPAPATPPQAATAAPSPAGVVAAPPAKQPAPPPAAGAADAGATPIAAAAAAPQAATKKRRAPRPAWPPPPGAAAPAAAPAPAAYQEPAPAAAAPAWPAREPAPAQPAWPPPQHTAPQPAWPPPPAAQPAPQQKPKRGFFRDLKRKVFE